VDRQESRPRRRDPRPVARPSIPGRPPRGPTRHSGRSSSPLMGACPHTRNRVLRASRGPPVAHLAPHPAGGMHRRTRCPPPRSPHTPPPTTATATS
jgi:hypothetical protein